MSITVYGPVARADDPVAEYDDSGRLVGCHSFLFFETALGPHIPLTLHHNRNRTIGEVRRVELDRTGGLHAIETTRRGRVLAGR